MQIAPDKSAKLLDELLNQIVESDAFRSAPMMRTLLLYLWAHRGEQVSEYAVAIDALGRPASFDPKADSTVRVQISRLRAKLKEFYEENGEAFPLKLSIPLGRHDLQWAYQQIQRPAAPRRWAPVPRYYAIAAGLAFGLLAAVCIALLVRVHTLEGSAPVVQTLPRFWKAFLAGSRPVEVVIPSPVYFFWPEHGVNVRDLTVSEFSRWQSSALLREIASKWGAPTLAQNYVGAPEMNGGVRLLQYLHDRAQVSVIESRKLDTDAVAAQNTIFLGMPRTAVYLDQISGKLNFYIARVEPDIVANRNPLAGEEKDFREMDYSADRIRYPGIIALLPPRPEHTRSLLLLGRSPGSIVALLTSVEGLRLLDERWVKGGSPDAWEMVIQAETYRGDTIAKVTPVAFRAISPDFWK
jgi:hypothetical protein